MSKNKNKKIPSSARCPYCGGRVLLKQADKAFSSPPDCLLGKEIYLCENFPHCNTYVVKAEKENIQGFVASEKLRKLRQTTHWYVDILWKTKIINSRTDCYSFLANSLNIGISRCHIGMFDEKLCHKAISVCANYISENAGEIKTFKTLSDKELETMMKIFREEEKTKKKHKKR